MNTLTYCLDILKIKEDTEFYRNALEHAQKAPIEGNEWIIAMKAIANASRNYIFSQSQLSDFLTLAAKGIEQNKTSSGIIFKMYRDIIENYDNFSDNLKSNYPGVIVDVISAINRGSRVHPISIEKFYLSRKQEAAKGKEKTSTMTTAAEPYIKRNFHYPRMNSSYVLFI
jgi:hypothetical protein